MINKSVNKPDQVLAKVFVREANAYLYLTGTISHHSDNAAWGKTAHIYFPAINRTIAVKKNNVLKAEALVEIKHNNRHIPVRILKIEGSRLYVADIKDNRAWVKVSSVTATISHQDLTDQYIYRLVAEAVAVA